MCVCPIWSMRDVNLQMIIDMCKPRDDTFAYDNWWQGQEIVTGAIVCSASRRNIKTPRVPSGMCTVWFTFPLHRHANMFTFTVTVYALVSKWSLKTEPRG